MKLEKRSSFGWPATTAASAPCRNGLVVHYNDKPPMGFASKPHSACREYWRGTRTFHINGRGWRDIGYSFAVCVHGIVMEGRGWQREQAAQPGGNQTWTSVTFMSGEGERPTDAQINAFRELRAWLRGKGLAAAIKGHRDFISTSCPGSTLYSMVKDGALTGGPSGGSSYGGGTAGAQEEDPLIGLKKGDSGQAVKALQEMIRSAGQGDVLGKTDGEYGPKTAEALRRVRASMGSDAGPKYGDQVDGWAYAQLHAAVARAQGKLALKAV